MLSKGIIKRLFLKKLRDDILPMALKNKKTDLAEWYPEVIQQSGLADYSIISGCMVIKPYGYAIWEKIQEYLNKEFKKTGHKNAYFPMFIPESLLKKEAEHFSGFVPEVAWIEKKKDDEERYALRPTSETIICDSFSKWIRSWRDLPLLINQWCNIVRWETKVTRLFLRTREFLWQEGHTAHATKEDADREVFQMLEIYRKMASELLAIPVLTGNKSELEKFAGAEYTTCIEGLMPDGRALQMGTSHYLGQHFSKPYNIKFLDKDEKEKFAHTTSWGVSTRLLGAIIMIHGDDKGLVLPPEIAPIQVVIVPIIFEDTKKEVLKKSNEVKEALQKEGVEIHLDDREEYTPGWKFNEWELKGVPLRVEIGPKDLQKDQMTLVRRDTGEKKAVKFDDLDSIYKTLEDMQKNLLERAKKEVDSLIKEVKTREDFKKQVSNKKMVLALWCEGKGCEEKIKEETTATSRVIPFDQKKIAGKCVYCGQKAERKAYFAKAY